MIIIGENINTSIKLVETAVLNRDESFIRNLAKRQKAQGSDYLEVNSGLRIYPKEEAEDIEWLVPLVQAETGLPLCIDSAYPAVHRAALKHHQGRAILNSINGDSSRWEEILGVAKEYDCGIIGMLSDLKGIPAEPAGRVKIAERILDGVSSFGIPTERLFFDPVVMPVSVDTRNALVLVETLRQLKRSFPQVKTVAALSNMSYGLPRRSLINRTVLVLAVEAGLDAAIVNPLDKRTMAAKQAAETLLNGDQFCLNYIKAHREDRLE
ncbi:MAG: dihydropteroate synthase [Thermodesulfobacteriota bacterium]